MPSVGFSSKWKLTQDSSLLHQHVLKALPNVPWGWITLASRPLVSVSALTLPCVWHTLNRRV
ncbi:alpha/beta hydrolase [Escherichia coli]